MQKKIPKNVLVIESYWKGTVEVYGDTKVGGFPLTGPQGRFEINDGQAIFGH